MGNIVIVGATSGIAKALSYYLAEDHHNLVLAGRNMAELETIANDLKIRYDVYASPLFFNALDFNSYESFFNSCINLIEPIDGFILMHGYLGKQKDAQRSNVELKNIIDTNYTSAALLLNIVAHYFEQKGRGFICTISSVAGDRGRQSNYIYGSAKGGLSIYLQGLRNRLAGKGVNVITIKPGFVDTKMTYGQSGMFLVAKPEKVAKDIYNAIKKAKTVVYTPFFWRWIMLIIKLIPEGIFKKLKL